MGCTHNWARDGGSAAALCRSRLPTGPSPSAIAAAAHLGYRGGRCVALRRGPCCGRPFSPLTLPHRLRLERCRISPKHALRRQPARRAHDRNPHRHAAPHRPRRRGRAARAVLRAARLQPYARGHHDRPLSLPHRHWAGGDPTQRPVRHAEGGDAPTAGPQRCRLPHGGNRKMSAPNPPRSPLCAAA